MDVALRQALIQRLVNNPQDQGAITEAHAAGQADPEGYATLLEQVGIATPEPSMASHWLNEAANVWITTFNNMHRAATVLMTAVERCPQADAPALRLAQLYEESGDHKARAALFERRAASVAELAKGDPALLPVSAHLYEELGQVWLEEPLQNKEKAKQAFVRAIELDAGSQYAIYTLRELYKAAGDYVRALPYFAMERQIVTDPERRLALYADEAEVAKSAGQNAAAILALREALELDPEDPGMRQQLASAILEKYRGGQSTSQADKAEAARLFVGLAEAYPGEHGFLYALCALELTAADDRACQLAIHYGQAAGRLREVAPLAAAYLAANPGGPLAEEARGVAGDARPPPAPVPVLAEPADGGLGLMGVPAAEAHGKVGPPSEVSEEELAMLLDEATAFAKKSRKNQAIAAYKKVLDVDPGNPEAIEYLLQQLPPKRKYAELRDMLLRAVDAPDLDLEQRIAWLREAAGLCERQLRDFDTAADAWRRVHELTEGEPEAVDQYIRLLERARRWDELATILEQQAAGTEDLEVRIALERNLAKLHSGKRKDLGAAGEAWARIAGLTPGDEAPLLEAVRLFEKAEQLDQVVEVIAANVGALDDPDAQHEMYSKLSRLRAAQDDLVGAADALSEGAEKLKDVALWATAERYYAEAQAWVQAANATNAQTELVESDADKAELHARAAEYLFSCGDQEDALQHLEKAVELEPAAEDYANQLEEKLIGLGRVEEVADLFLGRAEKLDSPRTRMDLRRRAAKLQRDHMKDPEAARKSFELVLSDGEDSDSLAWLADDAERTDELRSAVGYLSRLAATLEEKSDKLEVLHREATLYSTALQDVDAAIERYDYILAELDPKDELALTQIAELEIAREHYEDAAIVLERHSDTTQDRETKLEVATRLADIYEHKLSKPEDAMRVLALIHAADPDDFDAAQRWCDLARAGEKWDVVAALMEELIAVEGDEEEVSSMTRELAGILSDRLDRPVDALEVLGKVGDQGDPACREEFMALGDRIGEKARVAQRVVEWYRDAEPGTVRDDALVGAFERFVNTGNDKEAASVAKQLAVTGSVDGVTAEKLEEIAIRLKDLEALAIAHRRKVDDLEGLERGEEAVRQAEVLASLGVDEDGVCAHGERPLGGVAPELVEPLLARLARLVSSQAGKVDVYDRQVGRCLSEEDRLAALCRAAEVATEMDDHERAVSFFETALSGVISEDVVDRIIAVARSADEKNENTALRSVLAEAMANGGHGARDGGKTRSLLLRRAAMLASDELGDLERALGWLADALIAYVDDDVLRVLVEIAASAGDYSKADGVLERARAEVFDGPMVRKILTCRADLREHNLNDKKGAAKDLKRLLDLAPGDTEVSERLSQLFSEMGDYRGMIQLYEDQILRGRDKERRADLARRVAILWQEEVNDPREAADAWRRVLRMKGGDTEAKERLAQAKEAMLKSRSRQAENAELSASPTQAAMADPEPENSSASPTQAAMADPEPENSSAEVGGETPAPQAQEVPQAAEEHAGGDEWTAATEVTDKPLPPSVPSPGAEASKLSSPPDPARVLGGRPSLVPLRPPSAPPPLGPSPSASSTPLPTAGEPPPEAPASAPGVPQQSPDESAAQSVELEASEFTESEFDETRVDLDRGAHLPGAVQTPPARVPADAAARQPTDGPSPPPRRQAPGGVERSVAPPLPPRRASSRRPAPPPPPGRRAKS